MNDVPEILLASVGATVPLDCRLILLNLKALKLPTFLREHQKLAQQCAAEGTDHVRYLA